IVASRSRYGTRASTSRPFGQITPILPSWRNSNSGSARNRAAEIRRSPSSGSGTSSPTWTKSSRVISPRSTSGIDALPERLDAEPLHRIDEKLVGARAQREIGLDDVFHHIGDFLELHRGPDQRAELGILVGASADRDLVELLAILFDAENADMADVMMTAGVDAAGDVDMEAADQIGGIVIGKAPRQLLCNRDRARIGERAIVQAGAGDDVGDEIDVRSGEPDFIECLPQRRQIAPGDMRQRQILLVADADFAKGIFVRDIGQGVHLLGGRIARRSARRFQRQRHDGIATHLVREYRIAAPGLEACVLRGVAQFVWHLRQLFVSRVGEARADILDHLVVELQRALAHLQPLFLDLSRELFNAELVHQDLDARLVDVVAAAILIVNAHDRLDVAEEIAPVHERLDSLADEGRAPEPAADQNLEPGLALLVPEQAQPDVVNPDRGAIMRRGGYRELELARQEREFRMQRGVLPEDFRPDAGVFDFVGCNARPLI